MVISNDEKRVSKEDTYLNCAEVFAYRSTCRKRKYGAIIVKNDVVVSTGYNGSPRGMVNCCDADGYCSRIKKHLHQGDGYAECKAIHAEMNALLNCSREQTLGADLYLVGITPANRTISKITLIHPAKPCPICARHIIQAGIRNVILRQSNNENDYITIPATELEWYKE